ncbi:MAG: GNAT family N-acetyltransferase [Legionellales bacterium]|nr:GNAT family N-acetyltransferase [Legionellales bacterium]
MLDLIEKMHLEHFEYLPNKLGFKVKKIGDVRIINCRLSTSMFNIAFGAFPNVSNSEILNMINVFKGQPFAWWIPPSKKNEHLTIQLNKFGFIKEANEEAMCCDLTVNELPSIKTHLSIFQVENNDLLASFISILKDYDSATEGFYNLLQDNFSNSQEKLFVGFIDDMPAVIGILYSSENISSIFSLITRENYRGKGYGSDMMKYLLKFAKDNNSTYVTLSSSSDSGFKIYKSLGFKQYGSFECFEYKGSS